MRDFDLRALQLKELEGLKEIDRICRKHGIEYMLSWGSAIGAIRHQGFIPWDDDIDVCMKWNDYLKFKEVCKTELDSRYFYQDWESDPYYYSSWAKIRMNDTTSIMRKMKDYPIHGGICLDVFPLVAYPDDHFSKFDSLLAKLVTFFSAKRLNDYELGEFFYTNKKLKYFPRFFCDFVRNTAFKLLTRQRDESKCSYYCTNGNRVLDIFFKKEYFESVIDVPFEDGIFMINSGYDGFLRDYYGDYMKVPEKHEQVNHGDIIVDLEKNYTEYRK